MKRRGVWLAILLVLCLPMMGMKCDPPSAEQEHTVEQGAGTMGDAAKTAAPFLPPPFNIIAIAVAAGAAGIEGWMARRRGNRAKALAAELETEVERTAAYAEQIKAEIKAKYKLHEAGIALTTFLTSAREDETLKPHIEAVLENLTEYKAANPWVARTMGALDALRKGYTTLEQFTESMKAPAGPLVIGGLPAAPSPS